VSSIQKVEAKELGIYQDNIQNNSFSYNVANIPMNGSYANRLCTENYEYEVNTNLSKTVFYSDNRFSAVVKQFLDVDFHDSKNKYYSKYLEITSLKTGSTFFQINYIALNSFTFEGCNQRVIIKPVDSSAIYFLIRFGSTEFLQFAFYFNLRRLTVTNHTSTILNKVNFLPLKTSYEYIYIDINKVIPVYPNHDLNIDIITYNSTGTIISTNTTQNRYNSYKDKIVTSARLWTGFDTINKKAYLIGYDFSYIVKKDESNQNFKYISGYLSTDLKKFYLTIVPYYVNEFDKTTQSTTYYYATTIVQNRLIRYKTNASIFTVDTNVFYQNYNDLFENSFSFLFELNTNFSSNINLINIYFNHSYFQFYISNLFGAKSISLNGTLITFNQISNNSKVLFQFKNNIFTCSFTINYTIYSYEYYIPDVFWKIYFSGLQIVNSELKLLDNLQMIRFRNETFDVLTDVFTIKNRCNLIGIYKEFISQITIPSNYPNSVFNLENEEFFVYQANIVNMHFDCIRDSQNGLFSIYKTSDYSRSFFNQTLGLTDEISYNFLSELDSGIIFIKVKFYTASTPQITLNITTFYSRFLLYSNDLVPGTNLLVNKAIQIMIPLLIFGLIIIGFKSNSDSKYFAFIGMYIALFTLYLMSYMSLLFLVFAFLIQTIGLYFIIKHERGEGI